MAFSVATIDESQIQLTPSQSKSASKIIQNLRKSENDAAIKQWSRLVADIDLFNPYTDLGALVQWIFRQLYVDSIDQLRDAAETVRYYNSQKKSLREVIVRARVKKPD